MADDVDALLVRLARAIAGTPPTRGLGERLCLASRDLSGADAAALTVGTTVSERVTLFATDETSARLEDLQEVLGDGPGPAAISSGRLEVCTLTDGHAAPWPRFAAAALELVGPGKVYSVPMRPERAVFGVLTFYRLGAPDQSLALDGSGLVRLAAAAGAAVVRDPDTSSEDVGGPWHARSRVHQATGMVVVQLGLTPDDALAVLRAHAYAGDTSLADVADRVLDRTLRFRPPHPEG